MVRLFGYTIVSAAVSAFVAYVLAEGLPEGAIVGALLGGSVGVIIAMRRASGGTGPSFEYEAAGIHDDNLITTARRNLIREAYRGSFGTRVLEEKIEQFGSAEDPKRRSRRESQ